MVTIKDIAHVLDLSVSTVSAVLRDRGDEIGIKEETRQRVRQAAVELGYRRNAIASQMQSGRSNIMVLIIPPGGHQFISVSAIKAGQAAESRDYMLKLFSPTQLGEYYVSQIEKVLENRPAAIFHWGDPGPGMDYLNKISDECHIPVVFLDFSNEHTKLSVRTDDRSGIHQAVSHLHDQGHRRIAHVTDSLAAKYAEVRLEAFRNSMAGIGLPVNEEYIFHELFNDSSNPLAQYVDKVTGMDEPPTAFCCASDLIALSLLTRLQGQGFKVPGDFSIIGYADLDFSTYCVPKLTTIRQPHNDLGAVAVELALQALNHEINKDNILLATELVIRDSTGPCRKR